jgi:hypothetical protein
MCGIDSSTAYQHADSRPHDPFCRVLNMELASGLLTTRKPNGASGFLVEAAIRRVAA